MESYQEEITNQLIKSKLLYAFSIVDKLLNSNDSKKIKNDLQKVWRVSGFKSQKNFEELFKSNKGISLYDYCKKMSPNCNC